MEPKQLGESVVRLGQSMMSNLDQMKTNIDEVKILNDRSEISNDAEKLDGRTLTEIITLIVGVDVGLTVGGVQDNLATFIDGLNKGTIGLDQVQNYAIATKTLNTNQNYDPTVTDKYVTPAIAAALAQDVLAASIGTASSTMDTIQELAAAFQNNPDIIANLQTLIAANVTRIEFQAFVDSLDLVQNYAIAPETSPGVYDPTVTDKYVTPAIAHAIATVIVTELSDGAPATMNSVEKLSAVLQNDPDVINDILTTLSEKASTTSVSALSDTINALSNSLDTTDQNVTNLTQVVNDDRDAVNASLVGVVRSTTATGIEMLTQAEYDALPSEVPNTIYYITD